MVKRKEKKKKRKTRVCWSCFGFPHSGIYLLLLFLFFVAPTLFDVLFDGWTIYESIVNRNDDSFFLAFFPSFRPKRPPPYKEGSSLYTLLLSRAARGASVQLKLSVRWGRGCRLLLAPFSLGAKHFYFYFFISFYFPASHLNTRQANKHESEIQTWKTRETKQVLMQVQRARHHVRVTQCQVKPLAIV